MTAYNSLRSPAVSPAIRAIKQSRVDEVFEAECARLGRKYGSWMHPSDLAIEEDCSIDTARRRMVAGACGTLDRLPGGGLRVLTENYITALRKRIAA